MNNNYKELAEAVIKSVLEYKNLPYTPPQSIKEDTYTVKKGDTLYSISKKYNIPVSELKRINNLQSNNLSIGQNLKLTSNSQEKPSITNNTYTVKQGDTLYKIATTNNTTVEKLKQLNNLNNNTLSIGQVLILPTTEIIQIPTTTINYTIKQGDTLYNIAKEYETTVEKIKQLNNLTTNTLTIGNTLQIPATQYIETPTTTKTHLVVPGDTLYSIARTYNTTVGTIKQLNNLQSNLLNIGDQLLIAP